MKKVALLKSRYGLHGGLEKYANRIAQAFVKRGDQVTILSTGTPPTPNQEKIAVHTVKTVPWPGFFRMEQFDRFVSKWLDQNPTDLIFGMDRNRHQTHLRAGNGVHAAYLDVRKIIEGKRKALLCQINPLHRKILSLEKASFENPALQKLFTNSHMVRKQILERYSTDPKKIEVIHNGVEWHEMATDFSTWEQSKRALCHKFNLKPDRFQFLFIGNGYLRKGLDRLLHCLAKLPSKNFDLSVIGKENREDYYKSLAENLGLKNHVHFFGPNRESRLFYQLADALVIPSFYDPFANVTVEALAMGLFVISSKENGGHEVLTKANGAIIEDLFSDEAFIAALEQALQKPKTALQATQIRESIKHLDFSNQLQTLIESCG
jgi:UDP-glucose:(heptosyl)LPS alpha-1,3-glucosyltransferase